MVRLEVTPQGIAIAVRAQPAARKNAITGVHDGALKVSVTAAPDKGKANEAIALLLAKAFGRSKAAVQLLSGHTSRHKKFLLSDISEPETREIIHRLLSP